MQISMHRVGSGDLVAIERAVIGLSVPAFFSVFASLCIASKPCHYSEQSSTPVDLRSAIYLLLGCVKRLDLLWPESFSSFLESFPLFVLLTEDYYGSCPSCLALLANCYISVYTLF